jgi:hypothetical protein
MGYRGWLWLLVIAAVAFATVPHGPAVSTTVESPIAAIDAVEGDWRSLLATDPAAALGITLANYRREVRGFTATLVKQERIGKTLHTPETIRLAIREQPFAVSMVWQTGHRNQIAATLFAAGENGGSMRVWRPQALLAKTLSVNPTDALPRSASRYAITESSLMHGHLRTFLRWKAARDAGELDVKYDGLKPVAELGGQRCHVLVRTCRSPEFDPFLIGETPDRNPAQAFTTVKISLDETHGYQIGADLIRADGERVGQYLFRDLTINPTFPPGQFAESAWK